MATIGILLGPLPASRTTRRIARLLHESASSSTRLVELDLASVPHHAPYTDVPASAAALAWKRSIADLDGLLVLTPALDRSVPGALKNAIDWASGTVTPNALQDLPVIIAGVSEGSAPRFSAVQHLRTVLGDSGARLKSQPEITLTIGSDAFDDDNACVDPDLAHQARELLSVASGYVAHQARARAVTRAHEVPDAVVPAVLAASTGPQSAVDGIPIASAVRTRVS